MSAVERLRGASASVAAQAGNDSATLGEFGSLVRGKWLMTGNAVQVRSHYNDEPVAIVHRAGASEIADAIAAAVESFQVARRLPTRKRAEALEKVSAGIAARGQEFARTIALEAGKPIKAAPAEVDQTVFTFKIAAEESKRIYGEIVPLDWIPGTEGRVAHVHRVPLGPIVGIVPFNFPLNLVAHKIAPALAAGIPIVLRPASQTPVSAPKMTELKLLAFNSR